MPKLETEDIDSEERNVTFRRDDDRSLDGEVPGDLVGIDAMKRVAFENFSTKLAVREWEVP